MCGPHLKPLRAHHLTSSPGRGQPCSPSCGTEAARRYFHGRLSRHPAFPGGGLPLPGSSTPFSHSCSAPQSQRITKASSQKDLPEAQTEISASPTFPYILRSRLHVPPNSSQRRKVRGLSAPPPQLRASPGQGGLSVSHYRVPSVRAGPSREYMNE